MEFHGATSEEAILMREIETWLLDLEIEIEVMATDAENYANGEVDD